MKAKIACQVVCQKAKMPDQVLTRDHLGIAQQGQHCLVVNIDGGHLADHLMGAIEEP